MITKIGKEFERKLYDGIPDQRLLINVGDKVMLYTAITHGRGAQRRFFGFEGSVAEVTGLYNGTIIFRKVDGTIVTFYRYTTSDFFRVLPIGEPHDGQQQLEKIYFLY